MLSKKMALLLFITALLILAGVAPKVLKYLQCRATVNYLNETKAYLMPATTPVASDMLDKIEKEIDRIRNTKTCAFPIVLSSVCQTLQVNRPILQIKADWIEKGSDAIKKMHVKFVAENDFQIYSFDISPPKREPEKLYSDAFFVSFLSDPNCVTERKQFQFLPNEFWNGSAYIRLENSQKTDWVECIKLELELEEK